MPQGQHLARRYMPRNERASKPPGRRLWCGVWAPSTSPGNRRQTRRSSHGKTSRLARGNLRSQQASASGWTGLSCSRIAPPFVDCLRVAAPSLPVVLVFPFTATLAAFRRGASGLGWIADDRLTHGRWILQRIAPGDRTPNGLGHDLPNRASCLRNAFMAAPKTRKAQTLLLRSSVNVASSDTFRGCAAAATYATAAPEGCSSAWRRRRACCLAVGSARAETVATSGM